MYVCGNTRRVLKILSYYFSNTYVKDYCRHTYRSRLTWMPDAPAVPIETKRGKFGSKIESEEDEEDQKKQKGSHVFLASDRSNMGTFWLVL